ncbi:uncharacterized protein LOC123270135 [Cotesia glomerata]|uniref:uncharacterized protein LOC123270135 n=1 Tax=Cotesia glomerata TaxID=32391 RepID=UPI001D032705|nr:uncharacterized protein LOC123270135 [Cotesia glomerata]
MPLSPEHCTPPGCKARKLATTLHPKMNVVIHYKNLEQCLQLGMKLVKVHRVLKFAQSPWLKPYIDKNTECRKNAANEFEKNFFKLMNNAVFGKPLENMRKHKDVKLVTKWLGRYGAKSLISKSNFNSFTILKENLVIAELNELNVVFNKPIYVAFSILDLSKIFLYDFHYKPVKQNLDNDAAKLLYADTDSLIYHFKIPDIFQVIKRDIHEFDTSDYPINEYGMPQNNKKVLGLMKDENNGKIVSEFIGLRAQLYAFKLHEKSEVKKRAKGVKGSMLRTITFDDFKNCLLDHVIICKEQFLIRSDRHVVKTIKQNKLALSWDDDKRQLLRDSTDTLPWGYKKADIEPPAKRRKM